ncbi:LLM class F420-dependent oxidoreductase [Cellulosimicrobium cellulans]|uniref:LLM class F420-dependent oxidoreductase n=1 Tax=Cellulosimicrobium cellulans TaxID=1710 RepID=A0A1Y0HSV7_CELCE|nr:MULTISPECIES: LLM class F420-dependent oxidoreductase [Cellulosimicrobium]ARU51252.1 LLM class F420-dependent oxidoreductase [Cellulosimicrobium cellulans]
MRLGAHLMRFDSVEPSALRRELGDTAAAAEEAGLGWISVMDHWFQMEPAGLPPSDPMLEAYTTLGYLAGRTETVRLGALVTGVTYRYPGLLAKTVATLDVLSGGRATFGIGAAWYEREHAALGVPFPPLKERFERLEETLQIARQMYDPAANGPYEGVHYQLAETLCSPLPLSTPEIMVGGSGERKTLRLVAQYADACNLFATSPEDVAHKLDVLRRHCDDVGRDPAQIRVTVLHGGEALLRGDVAAFVDDVRPLAGLGVDTVILRPPTTPLAAWVRDAVAPAVPHVADL